MSPAGYAAHALDELVKCFVAREDPERLGTEALASEINARCSQIARREICRHLDIRSDGDREMLEEVETAALEQLWTLLCRSREKEGDPVFKGGAEFIVSTFAKRSLADQIRTRRPEGYRLHCAAAYVLDRRPDRFGIAVERGLFGRSARYGVSKMPPRGGKPRSWNRHEFEREALGSLDPRELELPELIRKLIGWHGRFMLKSEILSCLRELLLSDGGSHGSVEELDKKIPAERSGLSEESVLDVRQDIRWLWNEIRELPPEQRSAVLLRMEPGGLKALATEAGYSVVAESVGMTAEQLAGVLREIPLDYEWIGELLAISAVQARGRRARAWERIERRYRKWRRETGRELCLIERWVSLLARERHSNLEAVETDQR